MTTMDERLVQESFSGSAEPIHKEAPSNAVGRLIVHQVKGRAAGRVVGGSPRVGRRLERGAVRRVAGRRRFHRGFFFPSLPMKVLVKFTRLIPGVPSITASELERLFENKNFSNDEFRKLLGREPLTFPATPDSA